MSDLQPAVYSPGLCAYRGRFAPSPTGRLHFGSLVAAVGSYLQARRAQGKWLVRIEDLDPPRAVPGAAEQILTTLQAFGFIWDEPVVYQSARTELYEQALRTLIERGQCYRCSCTRSELQALHGGVADNSEELRYPGYCVNGPLRAQGPHAWRLRVPEDPICFRDGLQGEHCLDLHDSIGDFIVKRRDGWFAYQLAVVVDDDAQGITEVVRGADLLLNTPRQIALQRALGMHTPDYMHLPLVTDAHGHKLAKSTAAAPIDDNQTGQTLWQALRILRQAPPPELQSEAPRVIWQWATSHWNVSTLKGLRDLPVA